MHIYIHSQIQTSLYSTYSYTVAWNESPQEFAAAFVCISAESGAELSSMVLSIFGNASSAVMCRGFFITLMWSTSKSSVKCCIEFLLTL